MREMLQEAVSSIELLRSSPVDVLHSDPQSALRLLTNLNEEAGKAAALDERAKAARQEQQKAQRAAQTAADRVAAVEALLPYGRADFAGLTRQLRDRQDGLRMRSTRLAPIVDEMRANIAEHLLDQGVEAALSLSQESSQIVQQRAAEVRSSLQVLESTQSSLAVLRQRLRATAQDILQRVPNPDHCPVCHTEFENGQLLIRMMSEVDGNTSAQATLLQAEIARADAEFAAVRLVRSALESIRAFLGDGSQATTVREALAQIDGEKASLDRERTDLATVQSRVQQLLSDGLSAEDLSSKLLTAELAELPSLDDLHSLQAMHKNLIAISQEASRNALQELTAVEREHGALAERLSIEIPDGVGTLAKAVQNRISNVEAAVGARQALVSLIAIDANTTANEIALNLSTTQQLVARVTTAIAQENSNDAALDKETMVVEDLAGKIKACGVKISRLMDAESVLDVLTKQSSGGELTNKILAENAQEIARTFASIHMPNEFELKVDHGSLAIVRSKNGGKVELDQMSTGQRAAFALSLFLAMNGRLHSGPPVLLFDDPVAHVDDINVLSFLDHLRHLAISGSRQIFFATADTKLAGLFRHKFRFLGEEFKEVSLSRA
jgi:hypothetical protein